MEVRRLRGAWAGLVVVAGLGLAACGSGHTSSAPGPTSAPASVTATTVAPSTTSSPSTPASSVGSTTSTTAGVPACATDGLAVTVGGPTDPGAGSASYPITFTNRGSAPCTLSGFPGVSAVGSGGQQLGQPASRTSQAASTVIIQPGQIGTAVLRVAQAGNFGTSTCGTPTQATGLRVYPPGQRAAAIASTSFSACTGSAVQLQINPVTS